MVTSQWCLAALRFLRSERSALFSGWLSQVPAAAVAMPKLWLGLRLLLFYYH